MFLHDFVMRGLLASIGKMPDYWVINSRLAPVVEEPIEEPEEVEEL